MEEEMYSQERIDDINNSLDDDDSLYLEWVADNKRLGDEDLPLMFNNDDDDEIEGDLGI